MEYIPTIGLEIHIELKTKSKMFCSSPNNPNEKQANVNICPICVGHPGTLPVINQDAVRKVIKTALALNCNIPKHSKFDRKNYFYPDLPKGYQISQYDKPLSKNGYLMVGDKKIRIRRIHLEEDTGKLLHPKGANYSLVDFNRAGVPLMELVTEPDIISASQAKEFSQELRLILRYLGVSEADMEKGQLRAEANISLSKRKGALGTKVEVKNLNSFKALEKAIDYEIKRQTKILQAGKKVVQETRGFHDAKQTTFSQREKEESHDYRYFPEPDLPIMRLANAKYLNEIKAEIPELPSPRRERFKKEYGLTDKEIEVFVSFKDLGEFFENTISELKNWSKAKSKELEKLTKTTANYILTDLQAMLKNAPISDKSFLITPENFAEFVAMIHMQKLSSKIAKTVLKEMFSSGADPSHIVAEKGLSQITKESELGKIAQEIIKNNPKPAGDYKSGKESALMFLVGQAMAKTKGTAEPQTLQKLFKKLLN